MGDKYIPSYNNFMSNPQNKQLKDKITPEEWNNMWNIIAEQTDNTSYWLNEVYKFLIGGENSDKLTELLEHYQEGSFIDVLLNHIQSIVISEDPPEDSTKNQLWFKIIP